MFVICFIFIHFLNILTIFNRIYGDVLCVQKYHSQPDSYHEWEIVISDSITDVHESSDIRVASVEWEETWPEVALQRGNRAWHIFLDAPWVFGEIFCYIIKAIWVVDGFSSSNQTLNFWILWLTGKLPVA